MPLKKDCIYFVPQDFIHYVSKYSNHHKDIVSQFLLQLSNLHHYFDVVLKIQHDVVHIYIYFIRKQLPCSGVLIV